MLRKVVERKESQSFPLLQADYEIIKDIRRKHSLVKDKKGKVIEPVHRREFRRCYRPSISTEECKVLRFYYTSKKDFVKALKKYHNSNPDQRVKYMQVGYVNVNLRLCRRCHDAQKMLKTDLYFVNILDDSSHIRETLCHGCLGAIINESNVGENIGPDKKSECTVHLMHKNSLGRKTATNFQ